MATKTRAEHPPVKTYTAYLVTDGIFTERFLCVDSEVAAHAAFRFAAEHNEQRERWQAHDPRNANLNECAHARYSVTEYVAYWNGIPAA